jgi:ABC-type amino acid transport substrate-binding protein
MAASSEGEPLVIATRHAPPFAIRTDSGWSGITIELVQRIAKEQGLDSRLEAMGLTEMLDAVARGEVAAAAAALTVTADREQRVDFTHPFFTSGLGIAVAAGGELTWISALGRVASGPFLQSLGALLGLLTLLGVLVWLAERRHNAQFPEGPGKGIGSGLWWSAVTMTTVGYGDKAPITLAGRLIALVWMFTSIIVISGFTAAITSSLTVGELDHSVSGLEDLYGMRVVTTRGSTSASFLTEKLIRHRTTEDAAEALEELAAGRADAVVYDVPILRYLVREHHPGEIRVLPYLLTRQDYGIALPEGTVLREELNRRILRIIRSPEWERMVEGYLGRGSE